MREDASQDGGEAGIQAGRMALAADALCAHADYGPPPGSETRAIQTSDGLWLRAALWPSMSPTARGTALVAQGRAEFIEKYYEIIGLLLARGYCVVSFDWRGQGGSQREARNPRKGHIDDFALYERDLAAVIALMETRDLPRPWYGLAHSMGGAVFLHAARKGDLPLDRMAVAAPLIAIHGLRWPRGSRALAETLDFLGFGEAFIPGGGETSISTRPFDGNRLTGDPARYARNSAMASAFPQLAIGDPTISWVDAAFRATAAFGPVEFARRIAVPTLVLAAGDDRIVSTPAIERFGARLKSGSLVVIPYARHELLMERQPMLDQTLAAFDAFAPAPVMR